MSRDVDLRVAAALLFEREPPVALDRDEASSVIAFLRRNRVPVAVLGRAALVASADSSGAFDSYVCEERERHDRQLAAYLEVAGAWAEEGIEAVLVKSPGFFPYTSSNVDVLVPRDRARQACLILEDLHYRELPTIREPYKRLFRRIDRPQLGFPIHVHTAIAWISSFLTDADVLETRRRHKDIALLLYPSPDNTFAITTAHWVYEDKQLSLRDLYHASLAVGDGVDWEGMRRQADVAGWRNGLELAFALYGIAAEMFSATRLHAALPTPEVKAGLLSRELDRSRRRSSAPIRLSKPVLKGMHLGKALADQRLSWREKLSEVSRVVYFAAETKLPQVRNGPLVVVSVAGPDGAGKTTLTRALQAFLEGEVGVSVRYHWLRLGTSTWLDLARGKAASLFGLIGGEGHAAQATLAPGHRKTLLQSRPRLRAAWCWVLVADFLVRRYAETTRSRLVGGIHIFDRDSTDAAVDLELLYRFRHAHVAVLLAPRPTVQILLTPFGDDGLYRRYEDCADVVITEREPLESLLDRTAPLVIRSLVAAARGEIS
jgi:energy-coupling factor transporter ATP-binding protein EcfA2